jgi:hypothetical protein
MPKINWRYKNTIFLALSLIIFYFLAKTDTAKHLLSLIGDWGYLGAFITGMLFVSTFTVAPSILIIYYLAQMLNPLEVAIFAGLGAVISDALIFTFLKNGFFEEIKPLFFFFKKPLFARLFSSPYFAWLLPIIGAVIIASPLPDELGIGLMGLSRLKRWQFLIISFLLNSTGLFIITALAKK